MLDTERPDQCCPTRSSYTLTHRHQHAHTELYSIVNNINIKLQHSERNKTVQAEQLIPMQVLLTRTRSKRLCMCDQIKIITISQLYPQTYVWNQFQFILKYNIHLKKFPITARK